MEDICEYEVFYSFEYYRWIGRQRSFDSDKKLYLTTDSILEIMKNPNNPKEVVDFLVRRYGCKRQDVKVLF